VRTTGTDRTAFEIAFAGQAPWDISRRQKAIHGVVVENVRRVKQAEDQIDHVIDVESARSHVVLELFLGIHSEYLTDSRNRENTRFTDRTATAIKTAATVMKMRGVMSQSSDRVRVCSGSTAYMKNILSAAARPTGVPSRGRLHLRSKQRRHGRFVIESVEPCRFLQNVRPLSFGPAFTSWEKSQKGAVSTGLKNRVPRLHRSRPIVAFRSTHFSSYR
jgi:hypothetical protein